MLTIFIRFNWFLFLAPVFDALYCDAVRVRRR